MKPPPRTRKKPDRSLRPEPVRNRSGKLTCRWQKLERRKLLNGLKRLNNTVGGCGDIDYEFLRKQVPTRSTAEIQAVVDSLKDKVISCASLKLKTMRWEEKRSSRPIEVWTNMASVVAGALEETITSAFSQMLIVSSTEPRTLRNCDPPQVLRPPKDQDRLVGRTIPLRPMPRAAVQGPRSNSTRPLLVFRTPASTMGPAKRLPALSSVVRVRNNKVPPPQHQPATTAGTSAAASAHQPGTAERAAAPPADPQPVIPVSAQTTPGSGSAAVVKTPSVGGSVVQMTQQHSPTTTNPSTPSMPSTSTTVFSSATSLNPLHSLAPSPAPSSSSSSSTQPPPSSPAPSPVPSSSSSSSTQPPPSSPAPSSVPSSSSSSSTHPLPPPSSPAPSSVPSSSSSSSTQPPPSSPVPSSVPSSSSSSSTHPQPPLSSSAASGFARVGRTSKFAGPRTLGVRCIVDFERIYRFLSLVHNPTEECHLTPMESAVLLSLLRSLPEEIRLLDCNNLRKHLVQVYRSLSAPDDSQRATDMRDGLSAQSEGQDGTRPDGQQSSDRTDECQSSQSSNTSSQSGNDVMGPCPPLNPFMVPLKLLTRQ
ncbi:uncharacterized protein snapc2 [Trachinotus anak]|uniref:uncharacterized protein snapc2 n=1 Tax=Trachinotus anak TaxID=443729 RepID=UPI0039F19D3E